MEGALQLHWVYFTDTIRQFKGQKHYSTHRRCGKVKDSCQGTKVFRLDSGQEVISINNPIFQHHDYSFRELHNYKIDDCAKFTVLAHL